MILGVIAPDRPTRARGTEKLSGGSPSSLPVPAAALELGAKIASAWTKPEIETCPTVASGGVTSCAATAEANPR